MITLQDFGSFYISGHTISVKGKPIEKVMRNDHTAIEVNPNGEYNAGAMYVQYYKPSNPTGAYLLIHGGGMTGNVWDNIELSSTHWVKKLLALQKTVYVIDIAGVGRSGYCPFDSSISSQHAELRSYERTWTYFRLGSEKSFVSKTLYENSQCQGDKFEDLTKQNIPRWNNYVEPSVQGIKELLKREPQWNLIVHSQGSDIALRLLGENSIKDILLIEPAAFPALEGSPFLPKRVTFLYGDYIDVEHSPFWVELFEKAIKYKESLKSLGVKADIIKLPNHEIYGNTHVPMCDKNSEEVFDFIMGNIFE